MTQKRTEKTRARALQANTGWSYQYCLNCVRTMTEPQIDAHVRAQALGYNSKGDPVRMAPLGRIQSDDDQ